MKKLENLKKIDALDFRNNKKQLIISYLLRIFGVLIFGFVFYLIAKHLNAPKQIFLKNLIEIKIETIPPFANIILLIIAIVTVLYIHEIIHAAIFYITHKQKPKIGIRGFIIFAAAPNKILNKNQLIINAIAPFLVITAVGIVFMSLIPINFSSWIYIPVVVNAAAAGGDFMTIYWVLKQPKGAKFIDIGDITNAYIIQ